MSRQALILKAKEVEEVKEILKRHKVLAIASLYKVRSNQLQELRKKLGDIVRFRVIKNNLMKRAIRNLKEEKPGIEKLEEYLTGSNIFLFTNINPFKLSIILEKSKVKIAAKAGDVATEDIMIPAGNTGLPPGPIISQLNAVGLSTRIEGGSVWINKDTIVARKGEVISQRLAAVLSKLGIKPIEAGLLLRVVYDDGIIITEDELKVNLDEVKQSLEEAHKEALSLSLNAAYPTPENIMLLITMAHGEAYNLAINAAIPTKETIADLLRRSYMEVLSLSNRTATIDVKTAPKEVVGG